MRTGRLQTGWASLRSSDALSHPPKMTPGAPSAVRQDEGEMSAGDTSHLSQEGKASPEVPPPPASTLFPHISLPRSCHLASSSCRVLFTACLRVAAVMTTTTDWVAYTVVRRLDVQDQGVRGLAASYSCEGRLLPLPVSFYIISSPYICIQISLLIRYQVHPNSFLTGLLP